ncbi:Hypothetical protein PACV_370 [Pacmanvirus A23]|uniref:Hypothetical protein n=1 Tax=Pacmanvirus A23 TaxID=1932881 RepID=UPI000A091F70|nr:Hypothetical protein B9W72_gp366 [Pacmanvirus A23]SIP86083.1 Hypothetical protein PACV_370 [Pacmanvirus A23]
MESLYYLTLVNLRKNQNLLTNQSDNLNHIIKDDIAQIIKTENHLSYYLRCRNIYNWGAVYSYIAKYFPGSKYVASDIKIHNLDLTKLKTYLEDYYITDKGHVYQYSTDTTHYIINLYCYKYEYRLTPRKDFISIILIKDNDIVISEEFFNEFPGLLNWLEERGYASNQLVIRKDSLFPA